MNSRPGLSLLAVSCWIWLAPPVLSQCDGVLRRLYSSHPDASDRFGNAVDIDGDLVVIGSHYDDPFGERSGAAYVFDVKASKVLARLLPEDGDTEDYFGCSVGISGGLAICGAYAEDDLGDWSGAAYLFDAVTGVQQFKLQANDGATGDGFGSSVGIHGELAVIGAREARVAQIRSGAAYLFNTSTGEQVRRLLPANRGEGDSVGSSVAIGQSFVLVGAPRDKGPGDSMYFSGCVYVFDAAGVELYTLRPNDAVRFQGFGWSVAVSGSTAAIGTFQVGEYPPGFTDGVYLFDLTTGTQLHKLIHSGDNSDSFKVDVGIHGDRVILGSTREEEYRGAAYLFDAVTGTQLARLKGDDGQQPGSAGAAVAISDSVAISTIPSNDDLLPGAGAADIFRLDHLAYESCSSNPNSSGAAASLSVCGSTSLSANDFSLGAGPVPNQPFLFFYGTDPIAAPFGDGVLCAGGTITRLGPAGTASGNQASRSLDLPSAGIGTPGTWYFQCWFRDTAAGGGGFNTSSAVAVTFAP